jgi:hypothetical protein
MEFIPGFIIILPDDIEQGGILSTVRPGVCGSGGGKGAGFQPGRLGRAGADFGGFPAWGAEKGQKRPNSQFSL